VKDLQRSILGAAVVVAVLTAVGPVLVQLLAALVPLVIVTAISVAVLRLVWLYTQRW
jgi:hypothetical protein